MGDVGIYLIKGMYRDRALLNLAHDFRKCTNCQRYTPDGCEPAHSNLEEHGKGFKLKGHDCFFAALCHACHAWLDNNGGSGWDPSALYQSTRAEKREMFIRAMHRTWLELFRLEKVRVI